MDIVYLFLNKIDFSIHSEKIRDAIKKSDFLISDDKCVHRLIGINFNDYSPKITIICARHEMTVSKQIAFELGKKIYNDDLLSARLIYNYNHNYKNQYDVCDENSLCSLIKIYRKWSKAKLPSQSQIKSCYKFLPID